MKRIIVTDDGEIREIATREPVTNAYAQFAYGENGKGKKEAIAEAEAAQAQQKREVAAYR